MSAIEREICGAAVRALSAHRDRLWAEARGGTTPVEKQLEDGSVVVSTIRTPEAALAAATAGRVDDLIREFSAEMGVAAE